MTILAEAEPSASPPSPEPNVIDPVSVAVRLRQPARSGIKERFSPTDPLPGWDLARHPRVARILHNRKFQFFLILPNQIIFWAVIFLGLLGTVVPGLNFATAITWYIWFCLVFVLMVVVGRGWCVMCPFGGFAEWIQRRALWQRAQHRLGLGKKMPEPLARYGFLLSVATFLVLTWIEEFFNIAGPGNPAFTSFMVIGIVASALIFFLVFERRSFCRYVCPLSALIGTVGAMGSVAGFRTRDRQVCLDCKTKDCMRGSEDGYGCPWYTWPGSADSNLSCGLCSECYKSCPEENVGLFLQKPLTSVVAPKRRRADVAWAVAALWGLVIFQQVNALGIYTTVDGWLNSHMDFPNYPNPVDYIGIIGLVTAITAGVVLVMSRLFGHRDAPARGDLANEGVESKDSFMQATSRFRSFFLPVAYGLIPVVGADYFARQLPKFFKHATRIVPAVENIFGAGSTSATLYNTHLLSNPGIVMVQVAVIALGTLASVWATWRISSRELAPIASRPLAARLSAVGLVVACGLAASILYVLMHAAS
ncbi:MAG: 4Fe-4S binding protein [Actinobacteria bacterium]|nr:4Fe-4S binding protein [Actinomycetota bacterium]